jgi:multicomponent K+:H+ antiporter subunit E
MSLTRRLLPHPLLSLTLALVWVFLVNEVSAGAIVMGSVLGIVIPLLTRPFWPDRPRLRHPLRIAEYIVIVLWDICVANVQVAWIILTKRNPELRPAFIVIPLDITVPEAITTLAGTITMTPGTVSADLSDDGGSLLVHCLHTEDPAAVVAGIKQRYEARLREIFP